MPVGALYQAIHSGGAHLNAMLLVNQFAQFV